MKPSPISDEVRAMIDLRHSAEQRGNFSPLGRLLWLQTEHGTIQFPADLNGVVTGPDIGAAVVEKSSTPDGPICPDTNALLVLGPWAGLPALRVNTSKPCPKCRHICDACAGSGKKLCELCGGKGWRPGKFLPCSGAGCNGETGNFKPDCGVCGGSGQIVERVKCPMCGAKAKDADDFTLMVCSKCKGTKKYSTGRKNGSVDWDGPKCPACLGQCTIGNWVPQNVKKFTNARLGEFRVLGPIVSFMLRGYESGRGITFDASPDASNDLPVLLVPLRARGLQKAYLVGGVVHERREARSA